MPCRSGRSTGDLACLAWIDGFFAEVRDYLFYREEDGVLILPPNRVFKLNPQAVRILEHLSSGRSIVELPGVEPGERADDVLTFFSDLKSAYENGEPAASVERVPFDFRFTRLPILGEIAVTYRCNNRCLFCYAACGESGGGPAGGIAGRSGVLKGDDRGQELTTTQLKRIMRIFRDEAKLPFFSFTGGEPALRPDLESLIAYARRIGLRTNLVSNGTLIDSARARRLARSGLRTAQISVEGPGADVHDSLTGVRGSFAATIAGIEALRHAGISVQTNTTLSRRNVEHAADMPAFLRDLGIRRFAMNLYIPSGRGLRHDELFFPYSGIAAVIEAVRRRARCAGLVFYWYSPVPHCLYNPIARGLGNKSCAAVDGLLSVSPSGDVLPCSSYPEPLGNLLEKRFADIWYSERAAFFKNKLFAPPECRGCDRFVACQGACPLYWDYAGTSEIAGAVRKDMSTFRSAAYSTSPTGSASRAIKGKVP